MYVFYKPVKSMLESYNIFEIEPIRSINIRNAVICIGI